MAAVCFCATFRRRRAPLPGRADAWGLPSALSGGARTFLPGAMRHTLATPTPRRPPGRPGVLPTLS